VSVVKVLETTEKGSQKDYLLMGMAAAETSGVIVSQMLSEFFSFFLGCAGLPNLV
jgi:hypothetical protein